MNKRQAKKKRKFIAECIVGYCMSYREIKQLKRDYKEYVTWYEKHEVYQATHNYISDFPFM